MINAMKDMMDGMIKRKKKGYGQMEAMYDEK